MRLFKKKIINDSAFLSAARYLEQFLQFTRGFIIARLLDPTLFGYLSGVRLLLRFTPQMHLGALHGMTRDLSIYKGAVDNNNFEESKNNAISFITIVSAFIVLGIIVYTFFVHDKYTPYTIWGIRVFAIVAFIQQLISICHALLRVEYRFTNISISQIILGISSLALAVILVIWIGFYGAILSFFIAHLLSLAYLLKKIRFNFMFELNKTLIKKLISVGAPISFFYFNSRILGGLDKLMIISFLSVKELGYYAIAFPFFDLITRIPLSVSYIAYPKMLEAYGSNDSDIKSTQRYFQIPTEINSAIIAIGIGILFFCIKYIFFYLLPRYVEAIIVTKILLLAIFFSGVSMLAVRVLVTQGSFKILFVFQGAAILSNIILNYTSIKMGYGIRGVATATSISYIMYSFLVLHRTLSEFYEGFSNILIHQLRLYWPILYVGLILFSMSSINYFHVDAIRGLRVDMLQLMINLVVFLILTVPLFVLMKREILREFIF